MTDPSCCTFSVPLENISINLQPPGSFPGISRDQLWIQPSSKVVIDRPKLKLDWGWVRLVVMGIIQGMIQDTANSIFRVRQLCGGCMGLWTSLPALKVWHQSEKCSTETGGWTALEIHRQGETWDSCTVLVLYRRLFSIWVRKCVWVLVTGIGVDCSKMMVGMATSEFPKRGVQITYASTLWCTMSWRSMTPCISFFCYTTCSSWSQGITLLKSSSVSVVTTACLFSLLSFTVTILVWNNPQW